MRIVALVIGLLVLIAAIVLLMPQMPVGALGGGGGGGWQANEGMILLGPMRIPAKKSLPEWLTGGLDHLVGFLLGCITDGCVVTNQPVGGGGGGGFPPCNTCNTSGPPGTTAGGGGGWARKANPWNWFQFSDKH
jgi:hypothetical protein